MKNWDKASAGRKIAVSLLALTLMLAVARSRLGSELAGGESVRRGAACR